MEIGLPTFAVLALGMAAVNAKHVEALASGRTNDGRACPRRRTEDDDPQALAPCPLGETYPCRSLATPTG